MPIHEEDLVFQPTYTAGVLSLCTSSRKSSMQLALQAWVLHESRQYSPSLLVSSGSPAQGSFWMCSRDLRMLR